MLADYLIHDRLAGTLLARKIGSLSRNKRFRKVTVLAYLTSKPYPYD